MLKKIDFAVGGQAVIEGVMMRSPNSVVVSVRKQSGEIKTKEKFYRTLTQRIKFLNIPILRGVINLFEMMAVGMGAINFSANEFAEEPSSGEKAEKSLAVVVFETFMFILSIVVAIAFSIFLFKFLPLFITTAIEKISPVIQENWIVFNIIDGVLKTSFFIIYIFILSLIPSFRRIFEYHGAEHKAVFTYERNLPLTVENARNQTRFHPRCGTSFILIVFVISILVYTFVPKQDDIWENLSLRLIFLPFIAGISYEYLKISAKYGCKKWTKIFVSPGLWLQRLTTKEPSDDQIEVALHSLKTALEKEYSQKPM